jgi:hypothetical protein
MGHVYATVAEANDYETSAGATKYAAEVASKVALKLGILESVSRRIDYVCHRSGFGSGFGPRTGINRYDGDGSGVLLLRDDLLSLSAFTVAPTTGGAGISPVVDTDYFLATATGYDGPPWRKVILHGRGSPLTFGSGLRTVVATGTWGYSNVTVVSSATTAEALDSSETGVDVSSGTVFSPGMTILVDTEQMYVTSIATNTLTVVRGVNGTTAASHLTAAAIAVYTYPAPVHDVALRLYMRRWKARDAGADGTSDGLGVPGQTTNEGEDTIIRRGLSDLLLLGTY